MSRCDREVNVATAKESRDYFVAKFLDHRIRQHFARDFLHLRGRFLRAHAVNVEYKKFPLPHAQHFRIPERSQRMMNRLSLRVEHRRFRHHPYMSFHARHYSRASLAASARKFAIILRFSSSRKNEYRKLASAKFITSAWLSRIFSSAAR